MARADLDDFVECYRPGDRYNRAATWSNEAEEGRWRPYTYEEIANRDKVSLDLLWLRDDSLEDSANLPDPHVIGGHKVRDSGCVMALLVSSSSRRDRCRRRM